MFPPYPPLRLNVFRPLRRCSTASWVPEYAGSSVLNTLYPSHASTPVTKRSRLVFFSHNVRVPHQRILVIGLAARIGFFLQCRRKRPEVWPVEYRAQTVGYALPLPVKIRAERALVMEAFPLIVGQNEFPAPGIANKPCWLSMISFSDSLRTYT